MLRQDRNSYIRWSYTWSNIIWCFFSRAMLCRTITGPLFIFSFSVGRDIGARGTKTWDEKYSDLMLTSNSRPSDLHANFFIRFSQSYSAIICVTIETVMENENKIAPMKYTIYRRLKSIEKLYEWSTYVRLKFIIDQVSDSFFFFFLWIVMANGSRNVASMEKLMTECALIYNRTEIRFAEINWIHFS